MSNLWSGVVKGFSTSFIATETITQYQAVKLSSTAGYVEPTDAQGEKAVGVALHAASAGQAVEVLIVGICPVIVTAYSGVAIGDLLTPSATTNDGKVEEAASGDYVIGRALAAPAANGDQVMAFIMPESVPLA